MTLSLLLGCAALTPALRPQAPFLSSARAAVQRSAAPVAYSVENPINVGDPLPDVEVEVMNNYDSTPAGARGETKRISDVLGSGKAILLGMPGAYTPTCNDVHLPGYYKAADTFKSMGVSTIALVTVRRPSSSSSL